MVIKGKRSVWIILSLVFLASAFIINSYFDIVPIKPYRLQQANDNNSDDYVTVRDANGRVILQTAIPVHPQDEYISEDNTHYQVVSVDGQNAVANIKQDASSRNRARRINWGKVSAIPAVAANRPMHVVTYHTHTDESYVPDSGAGSKPWNGDVLQVGTTFSNALRKSGVSVNHSSTRHDPHDIHAYNRSRRTLVQLLKEQPDAVFDIHRDAAPRETYITEVNGVSTSRVMIVIGRSNPNMLGNLEFAWQVKDAADALYPGLMRGIFLGRGDYNQDLYPTALLFEMGSQFTSTGDAEKAANCLADAVLLVLNQR